MRRFLLLWLALFGTFCLSTSACAGDGIVYAERCGAKPDGVSDCTAPVQAALDAAAHGGGTVLLGTGRYLLAGSLHVPPGVTLQGTWQTPHHTQGLSGTVLLVTGGRGREDGPAALEMAGNCAVRGLTLVWPAQTLPGIVPYPFAIHGQGLHVTLEDVTLANAYQGIALGPEPNELHLVRDVYGCPLKTGLWIDNCTDIGRLEDVHWNAHYWSRSGMAGAPKDETPIIAYQRTHLTGFVFGRSDWESVTNTFVFGASVGYRFMQTAHGACNGQFVGIGSDGGPCSVRMEAAQPMGLLFVNGQFVAMGGAEPTHIVADKAFAASAQFSNCTFWGPSAHVATLDGSGAFLFQSCHFREWTDKSVGAIHAFGAGGRLSVQGCLFETGGPGVTAGKALAQAIVTGNLGDQFVPATR